MNMKEFVEIYAESLSEVIFPVYKMLLDEIGAELDEYYSEASWYNDKEKGIMLYDSLDDGLIHLKTKLWKLYQSSKPKAKEAT